MDEAPLDRSSDHILEERALERALLLAQDAPTRARVEGLIAQRARLMRARDAFNVEATARRHARGEIYSASRIAALNAMTPSLADLEDNALSLYGRHGTTIEVLKTHVRVHFVNVLAAARLNLAYFPPDVLTAARALQAQEEAFAGAWLAAIDDAAFSAEIRAAQRAALRILRTSTRPMYCATRPHSVEMDDQEAAALGKAWNKLDELAATLDVEPLSNFIAVPGEDDDAGVAPARMAVSLDALCEALRQPQHKVPGKKSVLACLEKLRGALAALPQGTASAWFDIDL